MSAIARTCSILAVILIVNGAGCSEPPAPFKTKDRTPRADRDAAFNPPETYPEWAYDAERYMKPVEDLKPEPRVRPDDPLHYFTNKRVVMIRQPSGYAPEEIPRVAVWWTDDNGFHWQKAGYFGRQESHFPFEVTEDGDYGIRFVGPGQATADPVPAVPERVYHVDTALPEVEVTIEPEQSWYHVGETVTISWKAGDAHLVEYPVRIGVLPDFSAAKRDMDELQRELADEGTITYKIPAEALDQELRIRVDALDRAGNLGTAVSYALQVVGAESGAEAPADATAQVEELENEESAGSAEGAAAPGEGSRGAAGESAGGGVLESPHTMTGVRDVEGDGDLFEWEGPFFSEAVRVEADEPAPDMFVQLAGDEAEGAGAGEAEVPVTSLHLVTSSGSGPARWTISQEAGPVMTSGQETGPAMDESWPDEAVAEEVTARWQPGEFSEEGPAPAEREEDGLLAAEMMLPRGEAAGEVVSFVDPTRGNGLLIPLPATVEAEPSLQSGLVTAHPWRSLGVVLPASSAGVWGLPEPRQGLDSYRKIEARFLADHPRLRPAGEARRVDWSFAGGVVANPLEPQEVGNP